ncbi:hypothetical protein [Hymenobacter coccineus]|uniref:Uncharacterized protein n=1 Tax=Hymenobacter coccineus TaxID=1908235 RepID=A0A1G1TH11_9BACT|nr:hypothetical protein [Hymenobacter coccineus]OGX90170.1 hypothetical protein BEN49_07400 [Hymenobacter coccineus]
MENRPLYSAEITEIIGTPPWWIIRAGGGVLLVVFVACLSLASVVQVPEQSNAPVFISGTTSPYYVRQIAGGARPAAASGQIVELGQLLVRGPLDDASGIRAPFAGRLRLQRLPAAASPGDTIGLLVPLRNAYRFNGVLDLAQASTLSNDQALTIRVTMSDHPDSYLSLSGYLGYVSPVVRQGHVACVGQLDSLSNVLLARYSSAITNLEGTLLLTSKRKPLLQSLFK